MTKRGRSDAAQQRLDAAFGQRGSEQVRSLLDDPEIPLPPRPGASAVAERSPAGGAEPLTLSLPTSLLRGLFDPQRHGALALAGLALCAALAAGWVSLHARPQASAVPRPVPGIALPSASQAVPSAASVLVVDVGGGVRRPGLQRLPTGSRVADAVSAAGGATPGTSTADLNLARKLIDGEQIVVGRKGVPLPAPSALTQPGTAGQPVNLNAATLADLDRLPGVGPVLAQRILTWRDEHGGFASVDQLREIDGIGDRTFATLKAQVTV